MEERGAVSVRMENNILAGQKEASPYRQKISTSFHKDRDLSPGRPKGFCRARGDTKIRAFSFNTLPRSGDSTVSRITIHGGPRPGTAILKLSSIARKMRHKRGGFHSIKNRSSTVSFFFNQPFRGVDLSLHSSRIIAAAREILSLLSF